MQASYVGGVGAAVTDDQLDLVDWIYFEKSRAELGGGFIRILGYFREDGIKSLAQIEAAMHEQNSVALVLPAQLHRNAPLPR
jgi:hypothetical protein